MTRCPTCGQRWQLGDPPDNPVDRLTQQLAATCEARDVVVSWDGWIAERDAAAFMRRKPKTLANRRGQDRPLKSRKTGRTVEVELRDVARWIIANTEYF